MLQHCQTMLMHLKEKNQLNYDPIIFGPPKECLFEESQIRGVFFSKKKCSWSSSGMLVLATGKEQFQAF